MTHTVVYTQAKYSDEKLKKLIRAVKKTQLEAFYLDEKANTVVVHDLPDDAMSDSMQSSVFMLVYTSLGKGSEVKKRFVEAMYENVQAALEEPVQVEVVIKEQANDMSGINGVLKANNLQASSRYEL